MIVESNFKQKNYFCNYLSRNMLLVSKNLIPAFGKFTKRVTRNSSTFFTVIQKQEITKTINYNFFGSPGKLERYCVQE